MTEHYIDSLGIAWADVRRKHLLPERVVDWPWFIQRPHVRGEFIHLREQWQTCCVCGNTAHHRNTINVDLHHLRGGSRRIWERCNLLPLCSRWGSEPGCHELAHGCGERDDILAILFFHKWASDQEGTDWKRLHEIFGRWLPAPKPGDLRTLARKRPIGA